MKNVNKKRNIQMKNEEYRYIKNTNKNEEYKRKVKNTDE